MQGIDKVTYVQTLNDDDGYVFVVFVCLFVVVRGHTYSNVSTDNI